MARMHPSEPPPPGVGLDGERRVYELLRDGLYDDGWHVFWQFRFWTDDSCTTQREIDFIVAHPLKGVLFLEVKGGQYDFRPDLGWCRRHHGEWLPDEKYGGPYDQLNIAFYRVLGVACSALGFDPRNPPFRRGQGIIFPFCTLRRVDGRLPANAEGDITAEEAECEGPQELRTWVMRRMRAIEGQWPEIGCSQPSRADELIRRFLLPRVESFTRLASLIARNRDLEQMLTIEQRAYVTAVACSKRMLVEGFAGTGKTFMAILLATRLCDAATNTNITGSPARPTVAVLCFNHNLARQIDREMLPSGHRVQVWHFHEFCRQIATEAGVAIPERGNEDEAYYANGCCEAIEEACLRGGSRLFDAIIVDEGQDFRPNWMDAIEMFLKPDGKLVVFNDPLQDVYGIGLHLRRRFKQEPLLVKTNCRNTREIGGFVRKLHTGLAPMEFAMFLPEGVAPRTKTYSDSAEQLRMIESLLESLQSEHGLRPRQILLLSPYAKANTCLAPLTHFAKLPLVDYGRRYDETRQHVLFFETVRSFKGCEADVIILHDVTGDGDIVSTEALYVACSRARAGLYIYRDRGFRWPSTGS